jgi:hypothetical protein
MPVQREVPAASLRLHVHEKGDVKRHWLPVLCRPRGGHAGSYYRPGRWDAPPGAGAQQNPSAGFGARWTGGPPSQSDESDSEEGSRPFY